MNNFDHLSTETVSLCSQLLIELYLTLKKQSDTLTFGSTTLNVNPHFSIFLTMENSSYKSLPGGIRESFRQFKLLVPDLKVIIGQWLLLAGFSKDEELASLTARFFQLSSSQIPSKKGRLSLFEVKKVISEANEHLPQAVSERSAVLTALNGCFMSQLNDSEKYIYRMAIINIFGPTVMPSPSEEAASVISDYYRLRSFKVTDTIVQSVVDCHEVISRWKAVHIFSNESVGKSLALECVKHLSGKLYQKHVVSKQVFPKAYSLVDLYGSYVSKQGSSAQHYKPGVIQYIITVLSGLHPSAVNEDTGRMQVIHNEKNIERWIEFDGTATNDWMEGLTTAIEGANSYIILPNYEKLRIPENMKFLFKSPSIASISPSAITRLGIINLVSDYSWHDRIDLVISKLTEDQPVLKETSIPKRLCDSLQKFFQFLFDGKTIIKSDWILTMTEFEVVNNYLTVFRQLVTDFLATDFDKDEHQSKLAAMVSSYSFISLSLGVGSLLNAEALNRFEQLVSAKFIHFMPSDGSQVMTKAINPKTFMAEPATKIFERQIVTLQLKEDAGPTHRLRVVSPYLVWQSSTMASFMAAKLNLMILSVKDSALSSVIKLVVKDVVAGPTPTMQQVIIKMAPDFSANDLTHRLKMSLASKSSRSFASIMPGGSLVIIEDLNMPTPDHSGDIQVLERFRRIMSHGTFVDIDLKEEVAFEGLQFISTVNYLLGTLDTIGKKHRKGQVIMRLPENSESDFKETVFHIIRQGAANIFASHVTEDIVEEACQSLTELAWSVASVCRPLLSNDPVPPSCFDQDSLFESISTFTAARGDLEKDSDFLKFGVNALIIHLTASANDPESMAKVISAVQQATSKSCRSFDWQKFELNEYPVSVKADEKAITCRMTKAGKQEFVEQVKKSVGKRGSELHVIEETLSCLFRCVNLLMADGSRLILNCSAGTDTDGMLKAVASILRFTHVPIDTGTRNQVESMVQQLSKIVTRSFVEKKTFLLTCRLNDIQDGKVLRLLQDLMDTGSISQLEIDKQKLADALLIAEYGQDSHAYIKDLVGRRCRLVLVDERYGSREANEGWKWYSIINASQKLTLTSWRTESFSKVAKAIMSDYEDLEISPDDMETCAGVLASIHQICRQEQEVSQESFESFVRSMCEFRVKSKVEIRDQLRNTQAGLGRYKSLIKINEELTAKEKEMKELADAKSKELNKLAKEIDTTQQAARDRKR